MSYLKVRLPLNELQKFPKKLGRTQVKYSLRQYVKIKKANGD